MPEFDIKITAKGYDGFGWDAYVKKDQDSGEENPWIKFALDHNITLKDQKIKAKENKSPFKNSSPVKEIGKYVRFAESPWTKWQRQKTKPSFEYDTIDDYREDFPRKRPDWAKSFSERKLEERSRYMEEFVVPSEYRSSEVHYIEREIWTSVKVKGRKYIIERVLEPHGKVESVNKILVYNGGGSFDVWTNKRISSTQWECSEHYVCDGEWINKKPLQFLKVKVPWSKCF